MARLRTVDVLAVEGVEQSLVADEVQVIIEADCI